MFNFRGITVELPVQEDYFLKEILHLVLEIKLDDGFVHSVDLLSRESIPGVWDTNELLVLPELTGYLILSIFAKLSEKRQLLASKKLSGSELGDQLEESLTILLDGHENYPTMALKTRVGTAANPFGQPGALSESSTNKLEAISNTGELSRIFQQAQEAVSSAFDDHPDKSRRLYALTTSLLIQFQRFANSGEFNSAIEELQAGVDLVPNDHPDKPNCLNRLGDAFLRRFEYLGDIKDVDSAIKRLQAAINLTPDGHPDKLGRLNNLGISFLRRFERLGNMKDIDNAIKRFQEAVNLTPDDHPDKPGRLNNLGSSFFYRFERLENLGDIDNAIKQIQLAVSLTPDHHPNKLRSLSNLGNFLCIRFERLGKLDDIDNSIKYLRSVVDLTPDDHPNKPDRLNILGNSFLTRFEYLGNLDDIEYAIKQHQAAVEFTRDDHHDKPSHLNSLGGTFFRRFQHLGKPKDIHNAIKHMQTAVNLTPDGHPIKPMWLTNLGNALCVRFEHLGNQEDIYNAINRLQEAVNHTPDGHAQKLRQLNSLGTSLLARFQRHGNLDDIENAVARLQAAVSLTPDGHPEKCRSLNNLGNSLRIRFEHLGHLEDIDTAVEQLQAAVNLTPGDHSLRPRRLSNLGTALLVRFRHLGNLKDIDNAIKRHEEAVNLAPDRHSDKPNWLNHLGISLLARFERLKHLKDIEKSITQLQLVVSSIPDDHPQKASLLNNLGSSFLRRFEQLDNLEDVNYAVELHKAAASLTPDYHPDKATRLNNLGGSLQNRFKRLNNLDDIDNAIIQYQAAVNFTPDGHPNRSAWLNNLGIAFLTRFRRLGQAHDAEASITHLSVAASSPVGPPSTRLVAARNWIQVASITNHASLLDACEWAINIIPLVAWLGLSISDRHQHLIQISGIVRDAAAIAISLEQYDKALEWLEQGRSIVWTQILQLRTPLDRLRTVDSNLANRLQHISRLLDQGIQDTGLRNEDKSSLEEEARRYRTLATERDEIVRKIRALPDFQDFLKPPRISRLAEASRNGAIVIINVSEKQCDALALVDGSKEIIHTSLPDLTSERVTELQVELKAILRSSGIRTRATRLSELKEDGDDLCKKILAELWNHLVKPIFDSLAFKPDSNTLPRMWWCVTGPLAFLPIHAAGLYDTDACGTRIQEYAITSYSPTISALLESSDAHMHKSFRQLSVIEPSSGVSYIPNTEKEMELIRIRLQNRDQLILHKAEATKGRVIEAMRDCNWLHLACHGTQNVINPTESALSLHKGKLTLREIIRLNLPDAEFAFLSACQTMTGDENLSEESVHIAGGMLLAGYRSVVATMWSIEDELAPKVADEFYARLLQDGERPDSRKAAEALHFSMRKLREDNNIQMLSWIPFVHLGI